MSHCALVPKRKILQRPEVPFTPSLEYYANITEQKLDGASMVLDLDAHADLIATHGVAGAIVGTTETQTLTNKTLTAPTISSGSSIVGAGTGSNGFVLKNLKNSGSTALSGTQRDIEIDIGGVPYYFTVYPTKV